jgi:signal transduction histidine kinase
MKTMMKTLMKTLMILAFLMVSGAAPAASERGTQDEAVALVKKVIADIKKYGKERVVQDVQNQSAQYRDRDLYVSIGTLEGVNLANGANPKIAGKNLIDLKDADGKFFQRERIEIAKKKGAGWQEYKWPDPITKEIQPKLMYVERYEDLTVACGVYKN